jgi:serine protease Do
MTCRHRWWTGAVLIIASAVVLGVAFHSQLLSNAAYAVESAKADVAMGNLRAAQDLSKAFEEVAAAIEPSVVNISSIKRIRPAMQQNGDLQISPNSPLLQFFGEDFFKRFMIPRMPKEGYEQRGLGTGVVVSKDGYVLTNNHVIEGADEVMVTLSNDRQFKAKVVGADPKTDLAVLKIDATGLYPAKLGNSDDLKIGEWVVAAGQPFGLTHTVTAGIVSAEGRARLGVADYEDFIQTDAAINPGNSGGPLVNLKGEVIGINTAIFSRSGGSMGIGFAIPSNMAETVMESLIKHGKVVRGFLGVSIQNLTEGLAKSFGHQGTKGVLVGDVTPDSPADKGGLKQGDIITSYNGKPVENVHQLRSAVAETAPGTEVPLTVFRENKSRTLTVKVGELQGGLASVRGNGALSSDKLGLTVNNLTPDMAKELGVPPTRGVVVTKVSPFGLAARAGIQANDVILAVQKQPVSNVSEFNEALNKQDIKKGIRLTVQTGSMQRFVFIESTEE